MPYDWFNMRYTPDAEEEPAIRQLNAEPIPYNNTVMSQLVDQNTAAQKRAEPKLQFMEGMVNSFASSIPELFGMEPAPGVTDWREAHPTADLVSQLAGAFIPYAGAFKLSQVPRAAALLEGTTARGLALFGKTVESAPVRAGMLKEFLRYTPLELSRLGTGYAVGADMGHMFGDVVLSQALTTGLGGLGGYLKSAGKIIDEARPSVVGADYGMLPAFEYRMGRMPDSQIVGTSPEQWAHDQMQTALMYKPETTVAKGLKDRYFWDLENVTPDDAGWVESVLMKPNPARAATDDLLKQQFDVRMLGSAGGTHTVPAGAGEMIAKQAGYQSLDDLAQNISTPRVVSPQVVVGDGGRVFNGAADLGARMKKMIDSGGLTKIADETWAAKERDGMYAIFKRVSSGGEPAPVAGKKPKYQFGPAKVRAGDTWLLGKTDDLSRLAPEYDKITRANVESWSKLRGPYRQLASANPFNAEHNLIMKLLAPEDWQLARQVSKKTWIASQTPKLTDWMKTTTGLADQQQVKNLAEGLYDIAAPKAWKVGANSVYGRFYSLLEGGMKYADSEVKKIIRGVPTLQGTPAQSISGKNLAFQGMDGFRSVEEIITPLSGDELRQLGLISHAQAPKETMEQLAADGLLSPRVKQAAEELQAINENVLRKYVLPALDEAEMGAEIKWLEGFTVPRTYRGDFMIRVADEKGKLQFIAGGATPLEAQGMARRVIEEAASEGRTWTQAPYEMKSFKGITEADDMDQLYNDVYEQLGQNKDAQDVINRALRRHLSETGAVPTAGRAPASLQYQRTGIRGAPDEQHYTAEDFIKASEAHYQRLMRYASYHSWRHRFGNEAAKWGKKDGVEYNDLMRKAGQWLGVEGPITRKLDQLLRPVFGSTLGGKAATRIAQETNKLMYHWNLGIVNPSFALLNLLTPLQTVAPWIAFMQKAPNEELAKMMQMHLVWDSSGRVAGYSGTMSPLRVLGQATKLLREPDAELKAMYERALPDGVLSPQVYDTWVGTNSEGVHNLKAAFQKGAWEGIKETATIMSTRSEQFSRAIAFNAAYLVGKNGFGLQGDALYRFMRKGVEQTMYGYSVMDRARMMTGPLGSSWGLFKNWQLHFIGNMVDYAGLAWNKGIFAPAAWQLGSATAIGGLGATPLVMMADGLAKMAGEDDSFTYLAENWEGGAGDAVYYGLPSLLGVSLQASSTIPGTDVMQDIKTMGSMVAWERGKAAWKVVDGAAELWANSGQNPLTDPNVRDKLMAAFAPRAVFRAFSAIEGDYVRSMSTGNPSVRDLTLGQKMLHGAGFNIVDVETNYIMGEKLWQKREAEREMVRSLGEVFSQAYLAGDRDTMTGAMNKAITAGVDPQSVLNSANTRIRRELYGDHLSQYGAPGESARKLIE